MSLLVVVLLAALSALALGALFFYRRVLQLLRDRHLAVWTRLGRPSFDNADLTPAQWLDVYKFLWSSEHRELGDSDLSTAVLATKNLSIAILLFATVLLYTLK
jgi:hypothetical protein